MMYTLTVPKALSNIIANHASEYFGLGSSTTEYIQSITSPQTNPTNSNDYRLVE